MTTRLFEELSAAADEGQYSGVVRIRGEDGSTFEFVGGLANRATATPMTMTTRMATASGTKGFTALAAVALIRDGILGLDTPLGDVIGDQLPEVHRAVTIEHLLGHTSGAGDYLDEDAIGSSDDYVLDMPVHRLQGPRDYLELLRPHGQREAPGTRFRYNNGGYVMLALAIEMAAGSPYHEVVRQLVFEPAGMTDTDFLRSDRLPGDAALGYLTDGRTNVLHLPVIGTGDGGAYTTAADMFRLWHALYEGQIVPASLVERMVTENDRARAERASDDHSYGLGFWLATDRTTALLVGMDSGVSLYSGSHPTSGLRFVLLANNAEDVWPLARIIERHIEEAGSPRPLDLP